MKSSTIIAALSTLIASTSAAALNKRQVTLNPGDADAIKNAVFAWQANTAAVSAFLDQAASNLEQTSAHGAPLDLRGPAVTALNHEKDELNQKAVLESQLCVVDTNCQQAIAGVGSLLTAKTTLESGNFQNVVDQLGLLTGNGDQLGLSATEVDQINQNDGGRCLGVLPFIDTYFQIASDAIMTGAGDDSLVGVRAVRPAACG